MTENIYDDDGHLYKTRQGKTDRLGRSGFSCYPVKNTHDAVFCLLKRIIEQAKEDKEYYDKKMAPVGSGGYWFKKDGTKGKQTLLQIDPIIELNESKIFSSMKGYFI